MHHSVFEKYNPCDIVNRFKETNLSLYLDMNNISHDIGEFEYLNPSHAEGSIWAHSMCVLTNLYTHNRNISIELFLAGLLHDVGKTITADVKEKTPVNNETRHEIKRIFYNHHSVSALMVLQILKNMYGNDYSSLDVRRIIELVNLHMFFFNLGTISNTSYYLSERDESKINATFSDNRDLFSDLISLVTADSLGRMTKHDEYLITLSKERRLKTLLDHLYTPKSSKKHNAPKLVMLIGLPGSGKSTYRKDKYLDYEIISQDDIILKKSKELGTTYSNMFSDDNLRNYVKNATEIVRDKLTECSRRQTNVLIDMTNLTCRSRRDKLSHFAKYYKEAIVFIRSLDDIIKVNIERKEYGRDVPIEVINKMIRSFLVPTDIEFDKITYVFI